MRTLPSFDAARPVMSCSHQTTNGLWRGLMAGSIGAVILMAVRAASAATITVDASDSPRGNPPFWSEMVGTGTARLSLRGDLQTHFKIGNRELGMKRVRGHGILNDDMEVYQGPGNYNWEKFDTVLAGYAAAGMRPGMELSFMPKALARNGNDRDPPSDYGTYSDFIQAVVQRAVELYGADDVAQWYWEVWNEPNYEGFWTGSMDDYFQMYDAAVAGATAALPNVFIGGPVTTQGSTSQMTSFLQHMQQSGSRVSFLASHAYPGGSGDSANATFGREDNDGRVGVLRNAGFSIAEMPSLNTEWNSSYTGQGGNVYGNTVSMDSHANAPFILKSVKLLADQVEGDTPPLAVFSYWTISDVFDESSGPEGSYILANNGIPFGQVFGMINFQGLRKAAFNAFKMLNYLGPKQLSVSGGTGDADGVDAMATISASSDEVAVILYNYKAMMNSTGEESVTLNVNNLPFAGQEVFVTKFVIDEQHSNPYGVWVGQNKPTSPSEEQWREMRSAQHLALAEPVSKETLSDTYTTTMTLPVQGAAMIILGLKRPVTGRNALVDMEGEDYDGQSGVTKDDCSDESLGQSISASSGGYIYYNSVDFTDTGVGSVELRVNAQSATSLELRAGSEDGDLLGTCSIAATNGSWATQTCELTPTTGVHDVYANFQGAMELNSLKFVAAGACTDCGGAGGESSVGGGGGTAQGGVSPDSGGTPGETGGIPGETGGVPGEVGGGPVTTGGVSNTGGGSLVLGGATGNGGATTPTGGSLGSGGATPIGGALANGGVPPTTGGASGLGGGAPGSGGLVNPSSGGATATAGGAANVAGLPATVGGGGDQTAAGAEAVDSTDSDDSGCGCRIPSGHSSPYGRLVLLGLAGLGLVRGRRRRMV